MLQVLSGFFIVWAIIGVGYFIGRRNVLGNNAGQVLSRLAFFVGSPALLFETLSKADLKAVFAQPLLVAAVSAVGTALLFLLVSRLFFKRSLPETLIGSMSSSLANSANLGIPIAVFVLGDASYVAPLLIFQLAFFTPAYLMVLDAATNAEMARSRATTDSAGTRRSALRSTPLMFLLIIVRNPMIIGSALGLLAAAYKWTPPELILEPIHLIGGAAVPAMLLSFGMSLNGTKPLQASEGRRTDTLVASAFKLFLHPLLALVFARFALNLDGHALFAAVVAASLPTAQNVFVAATRYQQGVTVAKDVVLITTVLAVPAMVGIAALLG
ncbi:AEC family transporter [Pseudarthrobacter sp. J1738]|uniref:AEC family transporter n=1 Tax=Pseudarthrobacter sp. J1738 TaxID=3420446 RepID=UPI003D2C5E88